LGIVLFSNKFVFMGLGCQPSAQPPAWMARVSLFVWTPLLTCLAWETLPLATLFSAYCVKSLDRVSPTTTARQSYHQGVWYWLDALKSWHIQISLNVGEI
jgi:hypothetical protein